MLAAVTGGSGFLASELVALLLHKGYRVHATVRSLAPSPTLRALRALPHASARLSLFEADLLAPRAFDQCLRGASRVFHTASPFVTSNITDPHAQLYAPALEGTRNVFDSLVRVGAPRARLVLTSSVAALMGKPGDKQGCFDEDDWNFSSTAAGNPPGDGLDMYRYSKLIAEREAWELASAHQMELATILPSFIVGPPRIPRTDGESLRNMKQALSGEMPHRTDTPMVDVRDCAAAHVAAAEVEAAAGKRFLTSSEHAVPRARLLELLRGAYPELGIADGGTPPDRGALRRVFCSKNLPLLGVELRDPEESILDMARAMLEMGSATSAARASP